MDDKVSSALQYIENYLGNRITLMILAKKCQTNRTDLYRRFKKATGYSVKRFVIQKRMERAISLLRSNALSVKEISNKVGYRSYPSFINAFYKYFGNYPKYYRNRDIAIREERIDNSDARSDNQ